MQNLLAHIQISVSTSKDEVMGEVREIRTQLTSQGTDIAELKKKQADQATDIADLRNELQKVKDGEL